MILDKPLSIKEIVGSEAERNKFFLFIDLVSRLVEEGRDMDTGKGSVSIAVNGDWGSGKTTYLKAVESFYRDYCGFPVVFFEAWKYQEEENPLVPLVMEIKESIGISPRFKAKLTRIVKPIAAAGLTLSDMLLHSLTGKSIDDMGKSLKRVEDEFYKRSSKHRDNLKELREAIKGLTRDFKLKNVNRDFQKEWEAYSSELNAPGQNNFVLIIDDLDRLVPEKAFKMIETLRFYFDIDNVLIVMGINDEILNDYVYEHYGLRQNNSQNKNRGENFLEKIFQWQYELSSVEILDYHLSGIKESKLLSPEETDKIKIILKKLDPLTHRKWIKVCNRIEKEIRIEINNNETVVSPGKTIFFALLKELYPGFEALSRRFSEDMLGDVFSKGTESEDVLVKEAIDKIKSDTSFFYFPERNFESIRKAAMPAFEENGVL